MPDDKHGDDFALEPDVENGKLPERVVDELVHCRTIAKDYAQAYSDAAKAQAERYGIPVGAVKRYIAWLADDKMADGRNEVDALERLMMEA